MTSSPICSCKNWRSLTARAADFLAPKGFELVQPFCIVWYNSAVPKQFHLPPPQSLLTSSEQDPAASDNALGILIGNTSSFWQPFTEFLKHKPIEYLAPESHPVDDYTRQTINELQSVLSACICNSTQPVTNSSAPIQSYIRHSFDGVELRIGFQPCAHQSGMAFYNRSCGLNLHAKYGPWIALRSVVVLNVQGPVDAPIPTLVDPLPVDMNESLSSRVQSLIASGKYEWREWATMRDDVGRYMNTQQYRYDPVMMEYHYTKNRGLLHPFVSKNL